MYAYASGDGYVSVSKVSGRRL